MSCKFIVELIRLNALSFIFITLLLTVISENYLTLGSSDFINHLVAVGTSGVDLYIKFFNSFLYNK